MNWPTPQDPCGRLHWEITEDWLREHGFRIEDNRNDSRLPIRRLPVGGDRVERGAFASPDDLCIDIAPVNPTNHDGRWYVWLMQVEPYRHIHVRFMRYTWEIAKLYEGLTGRTWPGVIGTAKEAT